MSSLHIASKKLPCDLCHVLLCSVEAVSQISPVYKQAFYQEATLGNSLGAELQTGNALLSRLNSSSKCRADSKDVEIRRCKPPACQMCLRVKLQRCGLSVSQLVSQSPHQAAPLVFIHSTASFWKNYSRWHAMETEPRLRLIFTSGGEKYIMWAARQQSSPDGGKKSVWVSQWNKRKRNKSKMHKKRTVDLKRRN